MDAASLTQELTTRRFGRRVEYASRIDSTNARAMAAVEAAGQPPPDGTAFVAEVQTRGRGTGGSRWYSDAEGLWLSVVLWEPLRAKPLSFVPGIALVDTLRLDFGIDAHVKWPNDVLVGSRKLSGSLIESQRCRDGRLAWIMGIGVNVNQQQFPDAIAGTAVSMRMATGWAYRREDVFAALMARLEQVYDAAGSSRFDLVAAWRARSRMLGRRARIARGGRTLALTALDVSPEGYLEVAFDGGQRELLVASADLDLRPEYPEYEDDGERVG